MRLIEALEFDDDGQADGLLGEEVAQLLVELERHFGARRRALLAGRAKRREALLSGILPDFLEEKAPLRDAHWEVAEAPKPLLDRRVGLLFAPGAQLDRVRATRARVLVADVADTVAPDWSAVLGAHRSVRDAACARAGGPDGSGGGSAVLVVRPRDLALEEPHVRVDGRPIAASLFDFGCYTANCALFALDGGFAPYFSLGGLEGHLEARWWRDVFAFAETRLALGAGTLRTSVAIDSLPAAFEMEEMLDELSDHACALEAGTRDFLRSLLEFRPGAAPRADLDALDPDEPCLRAFFELLVRSAHRRGAHALGSASALGGGLAPTSPARRAAVAAWARREASDGFDGTLVGDEGLVAAAVSPFDAVLGIAPNQLARARADVWVTARDLLDTSHDSPGATKSGIASDVRRCLAYVAALLAGSGSVEVDGIGVDRSLAELSRARVWSLRRSGTVLEEGTRLGDAFVGSVLDAEYVRACAAEGSDPERLGAARNIVEAAVLADSPTDLSTAAR